MDAPGPDPTLDLTLDRALDRLYTAGPDRFVAERDALVKVLRSTDKAAAATVKALRKPPVTAWALNQVARSHPSDLAALVEADESVAGSQRSGAGRAALTAASSVRRDVIRRLLDAAVAALDDGGHPASPANRDRMAQTLAAIAVDAEGREALLSGRLTQDLTPESLWEAAPPAFGGGPATGTSPAKVAPAGEESPTGEVAPAAGAGEVAEEVARALARSQARALAAAADSAEAEASRAEAAAERAEAEAAELQGKAERACTAARRARAEAGALREEATRRREEAAAAAERVTSGDPGRPPD